MTKKKIAKTYRISTEAAARFAELGQTVCKMFEGLVTDEGGGDDSGANLGELTDAVVPAVVFYSRAAAVANLAEAELWHLAADAIDAIAEDARELYVTATEFDEDDYILTKALMAEALVLAAKPAVLDHHAAVAACLLGDACKAASEIIGVKVVAAIG